MRIPLASYGRRELILATVLLAALAAVGGMLFRPAALLPAAVWVYVLSFFRDPPRRPELPTGLLSPADGVVTDISPVGPDSGLGVAATRIGVFMSVFNCHVNRSPCRGTVVRVDHHGGGFVDARRPDASETNESATVLLDCPDGDRTFPVAIRQVAGLVARRIVTDVRIGQVLGRGERIGMIKFGYRVELLVPEDRLGAIAVRVGQKVKAGRTVLVAAGTQEAEA